MKRLVKEGLITSLIGIGIIIFSGAMIWTAKATPTDMSGWIATGLLFLRSKDSIINLNKKEE
jgi:hypothetical protein